MGSKNLNVATILIILVGAFMLLSGIAALTGNTTGAGGFFHDFSRTFGGSGNTVNIIFAVVEIAAGALLILSRIMSVGSLDKLLRLVIFVFWIVFMVFNLVLGGNINAIDTLGWWISLVNHSIILVILWLIKD